MQKTDVCINCRFYPPSSNVGKPCSYCVADGREVQTRADQIRNMSDDELAEFLCEFIPGEHCDECPVTCYWGHNGMKEWLHEPADL